MNKQRNLIMVDTKNIAITNLICCGHEIVIRKNVQDKKVTVLLGNLLLVFFIYVDIPFTKDLSRLGCNATILCQIGLCVFPHK